MPAIRLQLIVAFIGLLEVAVDLVVDCVGQAPDDIGDLLDAVVLLVHPRDPILEEFDSLEQVSLEGLGLAGHQVLLGERTVRVDIQAQVLKLQCVVLPGTNQLFKGLWNQKETKSS